MYVADNYGRKPALGISWLFTTIGTIIMLISHKAYAGVIIGNLIVGAGVFPVITVALVYLGEISGITL